MNRTKNISFIPLNCKVNTDNLLRTSHIKQRRPSWHFTLGALARTCSGVLIVISMIYANPTDHYIIYAYLKSQSHAICLKI